MYCEELITAVENNASITVCIINDGCLGSIRYAQQKSYGGRIFGTELKVNPDLSEVAKSFKADGERVTDPSGLGAALDRSFESDVPYVIDVRVDPEENPLFA
jgi:acetolactate synthase-1/2/3 large subunit